MDKHLQDTLVQQGIKARNASRFLATASTSVKNQAINAIADALEANYQAIIKENQLDLERGEKQGLSAALLDRLKLDQVRVRDMAQGLREIAALPDPVGEVLGMWRRPNGLDIGRIRTPIGVVGIIYESRPKMILSGPKVSRSSLINPSLFKALVPIITRWAPRLMILCTSSIVRSPPPTWKGILILSAISLMALRFFCTPVKAPSRSTMCRKEAPCISKE
jgi:hypothetical protein